MQTDERPNIVLICVDQWRGDCLSIDGHEVVQTPYLDQLAQSGVRFNQAYSATPVCIPARAALHTGLSQRSHGRVGYRDGVEWNYSTTMAGCLSDAGYQTQAIGKMHCYPERSQMGFQNLILHDGHLPAVRARFEDPGMYDDYVPWLKKETGDINADYFDHGVFCNSNIARPWDKEERLHPSNWIVHESNDFLRKRDPRKPFFLFMSFHRPHPPYDPPQWAFDMYNDADIPERPVGDWAEDFAKYNNDIDPDTFRGDINKDNLKRGLAGYYGLMTQIDHQLNRFIYKLKEHGQFENTWFIFTSDHGEMLGEHHLFRKAYAYEGSARVPMILTGPKAANLPQNTINDAVVELRDIMPTVLDIAGVDIPDSVEGQSMLEAAYGDADDWREYLHGECTCIGGSHQWIRSHGYKYVWVSGEGQEQFFDMQEDPGELTNQINNPEYAELVAAHRGWLIKELETREEGYVQEGKLVAGQQCKACLDEVFMA